MAGVAARSDGMRKIRSREYCHDCGRYGDWEFEDREGNQILTCPHCGHMHFRVISGATIDFEIVFRGEKINNIKRVREILRQYPETKPELEALFATLEYGSFEDARRMVVTGSRWGQDPRQGSWGIGTTTMNTWSTSNYYYGSTADSTGGTFRVVFA